MEGRWCRPVSQLPRLFFTRFAMLFFYGNHIFQPRHETAICRRRFSRFSNTFFVREFHNFYSTYLFIISHFYMFLWVSGILLWNEKLDFIIFSRSESCPYLTSPQTQMRKWRLYFRLCAFRPFRKSFFSFFCLRWKETMPAISSKNDRSMRLSLVAFYATSLSRSLVLLSLSCYFYVAFLGRNVSF